jgi:hypothetical protein
MTKILGVFSSQHDRAPEAVFTDPVLAQEYLQALILENEFEDSWCKETPRLEELPTNPPPPKLYFRHRVYVLLNDPHLSVNSGTPHGQKSSFERWDGGAQYSLHTLGNDDEGLKWINASSPISFEHAGKVARKAAERYLREPFKSYMIFDENHQRVDNELEGPALDLASL